ncbi:MAG: sulfur oxidation c-type cytochrome SoxA [bacterium]|jgi:sulfur-oxidizing protein SoxA|nr:sulfur oxidation c-type cytochrome SoxA [Rhodocyclaceae bacterium]MCA4901850.1 sulfur oxidation c-type cytochrome SoxA [Rhodocyclaceae bacterium]MCE2981526.1 sulfur oxidation c-type cytochrome SoxA [Betaproteobacteria bacterium]
MRATTLAPWLIGLVFACAGCTPRDPGSGGHPPLPDRPLPLQQGSAFAPKALQAMQADEFENPGMLWVARGAKLWLQPEGPQARSCAGCHGEGSSMRGAATRYPQVDQANGQLVDLEGRIRQCRSERQQAAPLDWESEPLLSLVAYVAFQSRGLPIRPAIDGAARPFFERGREHYHRRVGQMNLSCSQCHDSNWGRQLGPETISQGHGTGYPVYRLEWQGAGSLQRRLRSCLSGVRAEMFPYGAVEHLELALYLAWRAEGLAIDAPGVRR